jgi:cysteine synthase/cystathionine beta-lyase/cystathionine gamma-synthase
MVTELITSSRPNTDILPELTSRLSRFGGDTDPNLLDVIDDLRELDHLINDLNTLTIDEPDDERLADCELFSKGWLHSNFGRALQMLQARRQRHVDLIERATRWANRRELSSLLDAVRKEYLSLKSALRIAYRQKGTLLNSYDWQSPIYACSTSVAANRLTDGISEHYWDYKRDGHLDEVAYEEEFVQEYVSHLGSPSEDSIKQQAYLTNCGMAAFSTVLHWLSGELNWQGQALAVQPMYFENIHLARAFFPELEMCKPASTEELLGNLRRTNPSIVFCDVVTNCGEVLSFDIEAVIRWASEETAQPVALVIDSTCLPILLMTPGLLSNLPAHVTVIFVESLAKYHQFGMDAVTGGIAIMHAHESLHESFRKTRAKLGTNITDTNTGSLPKPNYARMTKRMRRHSRNTRILAEQIENRLDPANGIIESISWLNNGTSTTPWYRGTCFSIRLHENFKSVSKYREYEHKVLELAKEAKLPLALSTSFGFDVSRLYVTAPSTPFEDPFLRVSVGTETTAEINLLADVLLAASIECGRVWEKTVSEPKPIVAKLAPTVTPIRRVAGKANKPDLSKSVFLGNNSLQNYLCPSNFATTPLVELPGDLNPFKADGVRLLAKMVPLVPLMNIKSIPAYSMLSKAAERGELDEVKNIIESSSSNTVLSLSVIGKLFGIDNTHAIVDHSIAPSLTRMLRLFGIEIFTHPAAGHELFGKLEPRSARAVNYGKQPGWINPGQYSNPDNPEGFAQWLGPDLYDQTNGKLNILSCALGTCGTMVGVSRALRERNPEIEVVACCPSPGHAVPGPREKSLLADVSFSWQGIANACVELDTKESFIASIKLLRRGILGGPSSGMNYAGILRFLEQEKAAGRLQSRIAANGGELWCTFLCCDSPLPHVDEYYDALGDDYFPTIHPVPTISH